MPTAFCCDATECPKSCFGTITLRHSTTQQNKLTGAGSGRQPTAARTPVNERLRMKNSKYNGVISFTGTKRPQFDLFMTFS